MALSVLPSVSVCNSVLTFTDMNQIHIIWNINTLGVDPNFKKIERLTFLFLGLPPHSCNVFFCLVKWGLHAGMVYKAVSAISKQFYLKIVIFHVSGKLLYIYIYIIYPAMKLLDNRRISSEVIVSYTYHMLCLAWG